MKFPGNSISLLIFLLSFLNEGFANSRDWNCNDKAECTAKGSECVQKVCRCPEGQIFNSDMTSCLKVAEALGEACTENVQCSRHLFSGGQCVKNSCSCGEGFYYLHGRCIPYSGLFGKCGKNDDCYVNADFEATTCINSTCQCSDGFYQREYRTCRRSSKNVGDACLINKDCNFDENAFCNKELVCAVKSANETITTENIFDESFVEDSTVYASGTIVGSKCAKDEDCGSLGQAECGPKSLCECKRAHFPSKTKKECVPELGESCKNGDRILIKKSVCRNGRWACEVPFVAAANHQKCKKASTTIHESCQSDEQCFVLGPDAHCQDRKCVCNDKSHFVESERFCWANRGYGEECQQDQDCYVKNFIGSLVCREKSCSCPTGSKLHSSGLRCVSSSAKIGMACEMDTNCAVANSECRKEVCACVPSHFEVDGQCLPGINATCTEDASCKAQNAICTAGKCSCKENHVAASIKTCLPVSDYGTSCVSDVQCNSVVANSECRSLNSKIQDDGSRKENEIQSGICSCPDGFYYKSNNCFLKKVLGETCSTLDDCYLVSEKHLAVCLNGKCACQWGYYPGTATLCLKGRTLLAYSDNAGGKLSGGALTSLILTIVAMTMNFF